MGLSFLFEPSFLRKLRLCVLRLGNINTPPRNVQVLAFVLYLNSYIAWLLLLHTVLSSAGRNIIELYPPS